MFKHKKGNDLIVGSSYDFDKKFSFISCMWKSESIVMQEQWTLKLGSGRTQDYTGA